MTDTELPSVADALLLVTTGCPHCQTELHGLSELVKTGCVGRLEVVNIGARPEIAQKLGVRSVPWLRIGPFDLIGLRSQEELRRWAERTHTSEGMADYFAELLADGNLKKVNALILENQTRIEALLLLLSNPETGIHVKLGIGAIMEEFQGSKILRRLIAPLGKLTRHEDARIRSDACHFLALTQNPAALPYVRPLLDDKNEEVREVALESLNELKQVQAAKP